jgi:BirA family biotin operon repressor/biotin-[acetyl-CoA-carboxylase] ligase
VGWDGVDLEAAVRGALGAPLRVLDEVGSTNDEAAAWAGAGAPHGALVIADHQTGGRGRRGRAWASRPGRSVEMSLVLRPRLEAGRAGLLTTLLGVGVADAVEGLSRVPAGLKWPNDVVLSGAKVAGILVEGRVERGSLDVAIAGIGINVEWTCDELEAIGPGATSIRCELERRGRVAETPDRVEVVAAVLARVEEGLGGLGRPGGAGALVRRAEARSTTIGRAVVVRMPDGTSVEGVARRLGAAGSLVIATRAGERELDAGEIERVGWGPGR